VRLSEANNAAVIPNTAYSHKRPSNGTNAKGLISGGLGRRAINRKLTVGQPSGHGAVVEGKSHSMSEWRRERNSNPRYGFKMALAAESAVSIASLY